MYGFSESLDLTDILGRFFTQLRVGKCDIQFSFEDVDFIVYSEIKLYSNNAQIGSWKSGEWPSKAFIKLFNLPVKSVEILDRLTLHIIFESGLKMEILDNSEQYESIEISFRQRGVTEIV